MFTNASMMLCSVEGGSVSWQVYYDSILATKVLKGKGKHAQVHALSFYLWLAGVNLRTPGGSVADT